MPIDHVGSMVSLAKQMRMDLDRNSLETRVQTETLRLLLTTLIDLGTPNAPVMHAQAARTVAETIAGFNNGQQ